MDYKSFEYIRKTLPNEFNWSILYQLFSEDEIELSETAENYLRTTPWNTNLTIFEEILNANSKETTLFTFDVEMKADPNHNGVVRYVWQFTDEPPAYVLPIVLRDELKELDTVVLTIGEEVTTIPITSSILNKENFVVNWSGEYYNPAMPDTANSGIDVSFDGRPENDGDASSLFSVWLKGEPGTYKVSLKRIRE